jgi:hypothetical protein
VIAAKEEPSTKAFAASQAVNPGDRILVLLVRVGELKEL